MQDDKKCVFEELIWFFFSRKWLCVGHFAASPADSLVSKPWNVLLAISISASRGDTVFSSGRGSSSSTFISSSSGSEESSLSLPGLERVSHGRTILKLLLFKFAWWWLWCKFLLAELLLLFSPCKISLILKDVKGLSGFLGGTICDMASLRIGSYWSRKLSSESLIPLDVDMIFICPVLSLRNKISHDIQQSKSAD